MFVICILLKLLLYTVPQLVAHIYYNMHSHMQDFEFGFPSDRSRYSNECSFLDMKNLHSLG